MTENEAKQKLDSLHYKIMHTSFHNKVYVNEIEALCMAKDTLEEIQQYRAIGTVEQLEWCKDASHWKELFKEKLEKYEAIGTVEELKDMKNKYQEAVVDWRQYRKIGTIEEFKDLKEKNEPKKPYIQQIVKDFREHDCYECPNCDCFVGYVIECQEENYQDNYCSNCGQKLDWE